MTPRERAAVIAAYTSRLIGHDAHLILVRDIERAIADAVAAIRARAASGKGT